MFTRAETRSGVSGMAPGFNFLFLSWMVRKALKAWWSSTSERLWVPWNVNPSLFLMECKRLI